MTYIFITRENRIREKIQGKNVHNGILQRHFYIYVIVFVAVEAKQLIDC